MSGIIIQCHTDRVIFKLPYAFKLVPQFYEQMYKIITEELKNLLPEINFSWDDYEVYRRKNHPTIDEIARDMELLILD